jgi:RimJ/RimL family protein N-acetyltransferase
MRSKTGTKRPGTEQSSRRIKHPRKIIRGKKCYLRRFENDDRQLEDLLLSIFNEQEVLPFLNREYTSNNTRAKIRRWIRKKTVHPVEVWYSIRTGKNCVGYVCFKWRLHYDRACELSTGIGKDFRGLKVGYESSRILIDYVKSLRFFDYIVAYVHIKNKKAEGNIRKLGFAKSNRLQPKITTQFYGVPNKKSDRIYDLYATSGN